MTNDTPTYCTTGEVTRYCRLKDNGEILNDVRDSNSNATPPIIATDPSKTLVTETILRKEDEIDRRLGYSYRETKEVNEIHTLYSTIIKLKRAYLYPIDTKKGDKIEMDSGDGKWRDVTDDYKDAISLSDGVMKIQSLVPISFSTRTIRIRINYRFGNIDKIPKDLTETCIKMCAIELISNGFGSLAMGPAANTIPDYLSRQQRSVDKWIFRNAGFVSIGG